MEQQESGLYRLDKERFAQARPIFECLEGAQPMVAAVLAGAYPGKVCVDSADQPRTALLTTFISSEAEGVWAFLAGDPTNAAFNRALNNAINDRQVIDPSSPVVFFTCDPQDWGGQLRVITAPNPPMPMPRQRYLAREHRFDWLASLPTGFSVQRLAEGLLEQTGPDVPEDVSATLAKWRAAGGGLQDFGFVCLDTNAHPPRIASWATVDFVFNGAGDIGFFTQPEYRRRGLAAATAAAALEYGFQHGLAWVNWTCSDENLGSIRTARKLGLERRADYLMYLLVF